MLELFLFINPISEPCRRATAAISVIQKELAEPLDLHYIPIVTCDVINSYIKEKGLDANDLELRNSLVETASQIIRDFKAAQFQGNKRARHLLEAEQRMLVNDTKYSERFAQVAAEMVGLDLETFLNDRKSIDLQRSLPHDTGLARQMGVTELPSAVLIDSRLPEQPAIRLSRESGREALRRIFENLHSPELTQVVKQLSNF